MKQFHRIYLIVLFLSPLLSAFAQENRATGFFTSEAITMATGNEIFVSIKKYNPTQAEIDNAARPSKNSPMNYLMAPFDAVNISMYDKGFESKLYSLDKEGKVLWDLTLGYSNKSVPSPIRVYNDFIIAGESIKDGDKVVIQKIDRKGKLVWKKELDSLHNVNDIFVDDNKISALVSFDLSKRVDHKDGTFSENVYPIYFFVQLDILTGNITRKEYQRMGNYLSSMGFSNAYIDSDHSYYLNSMDSAVFLNVNKQESATVVSEDMTKEHSIVKLAADEGSYQLLTLLNSGKNKKVYSLVSDFYGKSKKYESEIPVEYNKMDRQFIYRTGGDSILSVIGNAKNISINYTGIEGKSTLYKKITDVVSPVVASGTMQGKVYILQVEGRIKPGVIGRIKVDSY